MRETSKNKYDELSAGIDTIIMALGSISSVIKDMGEKVEEDAQVMEQMEETIKSLMTHSKGQEEELDRRLASIEKKELGIQVLNESVRNRDMIIEGLREKAKDWAVEKLEKDMTSDRYCNDCGVFIDNAVEGHLTHVGTNWLCDSCIAKLRDEPQGRE